MTSYQKFLKEKSNGDLTNPTSYASLLILSAVEGGREDCLKRFTFDNIRQQLNDRRKEKWGKSLTN
ncbi:hypothetical protein [Psychrobacillus sp. FSL H8-0487]|uniref:hypothetical protein n=1 Tax=Psychrobacillus sp. FSL H8-0487 TaxID=2921391 RepID=UPI0030FB231A